MHKLLNRIRGSWQKFDRLISKQKCSTVMVVKHLVLVHANKNHKLMIKISKDARFLLDDFGK